MTLATIVNRLKAEGTIEQVRVNRYKVNRTIRSQALEIRPFEETTRLYTLSEIHQLFAVRQGTEFVFRTNPVRTHSQTPSMPSYIHRGEAQERPAPARVYRTITRNSYHSSGSRTHRTGVREALEAIPMDEDGVRRSFGLEWEINALNRDQEDKLARLLDTLPAHFTEKDGSLTSTGVEIIFLPLSRAKVIEVFNTLKAFCRDNRVDMNGTGAHITYGVNNSNVSDSDLQIRINRIALSVKAACTQREIKAVFGRDFTSYASLPRSTTERGHSNAWSASRGNSAYELRLCHWEGDIEKITEFMVKTEFVFNRTFRGEDFVEIFRVMGSNASEA